VTAGGRTDLRRILVAYTVNELGSWFAYIALAVAVYDHTHSPLQIAALFICARCVPALLVPAVVARVEASEGRSELSGLYFLECVAAIALAVLLKHFWLPAVLLLVTVDGTAALGASALLRAAAARVGAAEAGARDEGERRANAALNISFSATVAVGPAVAGLFVAAAGPSSALFVDAASFLVCGLLLLKLRTHIEEMSAASVRSRVVAAWKYVRTVRQLGRLLVTEALAFVFFTTTVPVEVLYAKSTLRAGDAGYGLLAAVWGVGMVAGSLIFSRATRKPFGALLTAGTFAVGLAYLGFAGAPNVALACGVAVIGGAGNGIQWASLIGAVQRLTPPALHGQLMGAVEGSASLCAAVGIAVGGVAVAVTSPRLAYLLAGVAVLAITALFARFSRADRSGTASGAEVEPLNSLEILSVEALGGVASGHSNVLVERSPSKAAGPIGR
jgi:MFS family permease